MYLKMLSVKYEPFSYILNVFKQMECSLWDFIHMNSWRV